jgi:D-alanine-D-alanine ligase
MAKPSRIRVGVIFGGRSGEHEVSLMSARSVIAALDPAKYEVLEIGITHEGSWLVGVDVLEAFEKNQTKDLLPATLFPDPSLKGLYRIRISASLGETLEKLSPLDVVFPVLHGTFGEDGTLQGLLELADVAYVGAGVLGSAVGMDKAVFRDVMIANGIPVLETMIVLRSEIKANIQDVITRAEKLANYPLYVKPANLGSSVGISKCRSRSDLYEGLIDAARYDRRVLVQRGISAREIEVSVLGNDQPQASLPGEIIPSREFYSYEAKYIDNLSQLLIPAPLTAEIAEQARSFAVRAYQAVDCAGMARVDFLLAKDTNELFVSELNTIPGFTQISMYPKLWEASGLTYPQLIDRLIELAMQRKVDRDQTERRFKPV